MADRDGEGKVDTIIDYYGRPVAVEFNPDVDGYPDGIYCVTEPHPSVEVLASERDSLQAKLVEAQDLDERLKQEAQIHAQEASTANASLAECYQAATGSTGEPGNWNGANPVRDRIASLETQLAEAQERVRELESGVQHVLEGFGHPFHASEWAEAWGYARGKLESLRHE